MYFIFYKIKCTGVVVCGVPIERQGTSVKQHLRDHILFWDTVLLFCYRTNEFVSMKSAIFNKETALRDSDEVKCDVGYDVCMFEI